MAGVRTRVPSREDRPVYLSPNLTPALSPVRPRVVRQGGGEAFPLEEFVADALAGAERQVFALQGRPYDLRAALAHLAEQFLPEADLALVDADTVVLEVEDLTRPHVLVYASRTPVRGFANFSLTDWTRDEWIEYLLAVHPDRCRSVMTRLEGAGDALTLCTIPELAAVALDEMAAHEDLPSPEFALIRFLDRILDAPPKREAWDQQCFDLLLPRMYYRDARGDLPSHILQICAQALKSAGCPERIAEWPAYPIVLEITAEQNLATTSRRAVLSHFWYMRLHGAFLRRVAELLRDDAVALGFLDSLVREGTPPTPANAVGIRVALDPNWRPEMRSELCLAGAWLDGVRWRGIALPGVSLVGAKLRNADLEESCLSDAILDSADLSGARLQGANLTKVHATGAEFVRADLSVVRAPDANLSRADLQDANLEGASLHDADLHLANLTNARFMRADLKRANFEMARMKGVDFSGADLSGAHLHDQDLRSVVLRGACLRGADLTHANLEGVDLASVKLTGAKLNNAVLTGAFMPGALMMRAALCNAGLADVNLEHANLQGADLRGATFHMGSSRSGMLFSPFASEGTRTGFYTDESLEQAFRAPEEIRSANLCGADLRGANIEGLDFYLVDLRGARLDPKQEEQARRTGAILENRVRDE